MVGRALGIACLLASVAQAQAPAPVLEPAAPAPAAPAPPQAAWYRFTLLDGRFIDAQLVGGDPQNYFVQTAAGVFSLARVNVRTAMPFAAAAGPAPAYPVAPTGPLTAPPPPTFASDREESGPSRTQAGLLIFGMAYVPTVIVAFRRRDEDPEDHGFGYIPVAGPVIWTATDAGKWGEDGYDWLAFLSSLVQVGGVVMFAHGLVEPGPAFPKKGAVSIVPVGTGSYAGLSISGAF